MQCITVKQNLLLATSLLAALCGCSNIQPADKVSVDGSSINYSSQGAGAARIIFQAGLSDGLSTWNEITPLIPKNIQTFTYDRPGYGGSKATNQPRDPCTISRELHRLLEIKNVRPPYILVGHSIGGLYQYVFARMYPNEVLGLLLLDPTHPSHWKKMQSEAPGAAAMVTALRYTVFNQAARKEFDDQEICLTEPPKLSEHMRVQFMFSSQFDVSERGAFEKMVRELRKDWMKQIPNAISTVVPDAGHYIHKNRPKYVLEAITQAVASMPQ